MGEHPSKTMPSASFSFLVVVQHSVGALVLQLFYHRQQTLYYLVLLGIRSSCLIWFAIVTYEDVRRRRFDVVVGGAKSFGFWSSHFV